SRVQGAFDLVHSFIVLQHIASARGLRLVERLVALVSARGMGVLHLKYGDRASLELDRRAAAGETSRTRRRLALLRRRLGRAAAPLGARLKPRADPAMQMNAYPLDRVLYLLQRSGIAACHVEFTDHSGELGAFVFFTRAAAPR